MTAQVKVQAGRSRLALRPDRLLLAFLVGGLAVFLLAIAVVFGVARQYDGKVMPGVRVGNVDLSGLSVADAKAKLASAYAYLGEGQIKVQTPAGTVAIPYHDAGRVPDVDAMVASATAIGHSGDPLTDAVEMVRSMARGSDVKLVVKVDPAALATRLRALSVTSGVKARDAAAVNANGTFKVTPSEPGRGLDESIVGSSIVELLQKPDTSQEITAEATFVPVPPSITDQQAQAAADAATRVAADVIVTDGTKHYTIKAATVAKGIDFGPTEAGVYGPQIDATAIKADITALAKQIDRAPVNPTILMGKGNKPVGIKSGSTGKKVDVDASTQAVVALLQQRNAGTSPASATLAVATLSPKLSDSQLQGSLNQFVKVSSHTTYFHPGLSNGNGKNITIPARNINGTVVMPGDTFDFWDSVGPVDAAHGFKMGGVIKNGHSDFTGAMGGGICSASTTIFNAAYKGGYELLERHNHYYYISRYPVGLDATVYQSGGSEASVRWRNDTDYPVLIVGKYTTTSVTFELWSVPTHRTVKTTTSPKTNYVRAKTTYEYVTSLAPGQTYQKEVTADGFNVTVVRRVYDASGKLIHNDTFKSHYGVVNGVVQVGVKATPPPATPTPTPTATPAH